MWSGLMMYFPKQAMRGLLAISLVVPACGRLGFDKMARPAESDGGVNGGVDASANDASTVDAGPNLPTIVDTGGFPFRIVAGTTHVYWAEFGDGSIHSIPLSGGASTELVAGRPSAALYGLTFANDVIYYCDSNTGSIASYAVLTGNSVAIQSSPCFDVAVNSTHIYWTNGDASEPALRRRPLGGGVTDDLAPVSSSRNLEIAGDTLYWASYSDGLVSVYEAGAVSPVASSIASVGAGGPWGLSITTDYVYFAEHHAGVGEISRVARGGGPVENMASNQDGPHQIVVDNDVAFWTNEFAGTIMRQAPNQAPTILADGQDRPLGIAVTADAVFWTTRGGNVMRLAR